MQTASYREDPIYRKKQAETVRLSWKKGIYNFLIKRHERHCLNPLCKNIFIVPPSDKQKYCSHECHYFVRRGCKAKSYPTCSECDKTITQKSAFKFCSAKCQMRYQRNNYILRWKQGFETGIIGITTKTLSGRIERYIREKYCFKCSICGWDKKNPTTNNAPLEIDHKDGNFENNKEENLRLLCPNCHALTPTFKNLNKGHGRKWRLGKLARSNMNFYHSTSSQSS